MVELPPPFDTEEAQQLHKLYCKLQLTERNGKDCKYYPSCEKSCKWTGRNILPPTGGYVGSHYSQHRILFVGINTNQGSADSDHFYSSYEWLSLEKSPSSQYIDGVIHRFLQRYFGQILDFKEARRRFAFTNLVKCSVMGQAGVPTPVMNDNCRLRLGTMFQEIEILRPRSIVCVGEPPFGSILWHYLTEVVEDDSPWKDWRFAIKRRDADMKVVRLLNPPQGYQSVRKLQNKLEHFGCLG
jgi:hypothetical protein